MSTNTIQLYVRLLNEGTDVLRPTTGILLGQDVVRVQPTADYDPEMEEWEFLPGTEVNFSREIQGGREILVAKGIVQTAA